MTNIRDKTIWPITDAPSPSLSVFADMVRMRYATFKGFCDLEKDKGFLHIGTPLETSKGQEMLRILLFRTIEEYAEALESSSADHRKEELIDCFNYLLGARMIEVDSPDHPLLQDEGISSVLYNAWITAKEGNGFSYPPSTLMLGQISQCLGQVGDMLRNRSWMNHAQDMYFTGRPSLDTAVAIVSIAIFASFKNFEEFWRFFVAKDNVLLFRLRTKY